jgi:acetolactate synthase-1/2/3 large subunit
MKVSTYVAQRLAHLGLSDCFAVTGGGAMHLNDSFGECEQISCWYMHHEQAAAIAAEGYARIAGKPAIVNVTTGPGALNALNGIFGAYTDSIPMIVVAGQVRSDTISNLDGKSDLRQLGDQEVRSIAITKEITKWQRLILDANEIVGAVDEAYLASVTGRPGPVWLEIPVNIQGQDISADPNLALPISGEAIADISNVKAIEIVERLSKARRPLILAGSGVRISGTQDAMVEFAEMTGTPVATAWTHDTIRTDHPLFAGRPGTIGTRPGNFILQAADLVIVFGSRLNIRQVSYNWNSFAKNAEIIWVDIDQAEFEKKYMSRETITYLCADLRTLMPSIIGAVSSYVFNTNTWVEWCQHVKEKYDLREEDYSSTSEGINSYHLIPEIFRNLKEDSIVVCGNATACIVPFQTAIIKDETSLFSNSGSASMGYDLPAAIGAAIAGGGRSTICLAGDGSLMMNLQELETLKNLNLDILVVVLDNDGYLSIKQTQQNFFGHDHGASPKSGVTFPNFQEVAKAFGVKASTLSPNGDWKKEMKAAINAKGPRLLVAPLEISQEFIPRLKSKMVNGVIQTPELDDMFPHISDKELTEIRESAKNL